MSSLAIGFTTGTCAAAAAKAAAMLLCGLPAPAEVEIGLPEGIRPFRFRRGNPGRTFLKKGLSPDPSPKTSMITPGLRLPGPVSRNPGDIIEFLEGGSGGSFFAKKFPPTLLLRTRTGIRLRLPVEATDVGPGFADAAVRKYAGDDPDVTDKCLVRARVEFADGRDVNFVAGEGVGMVTKPGLSIPPGEPAINPVPRRMIRDAVREVTDRGLWITVSIPGGSELAAKTFNPRLGVEGGLSILGTSGIVRPFSSDALRDALKCSLSVAVACNIKSPVFVPGRIGCRAAESLFDLSPQQMIEVSNEWGFILDQAAETGFERLMVLGHPGKLAKLAAGYWDTHSSRSGSAVPSVLDLARAVLGRGLPQSRTVEGIFGSLPETEREVIADALAARIRRAVFGRVSGKFDAAVVLVNMGGALLGFDGDLQAWKWKTAPSQ